MSAFRVVRMVPVVTYREEVLIETDDWLEAETAVIDDVRGFGESSPSVEGTHPTHDFLGRGSRCVNDGCNSIHNGSYGSRAPCGVKLQGPLYSLVEDWRAGRSQVTV